MRNANRTEFRRAPNDVADYRHSPELTIRWANPFDASRLKVLAELDGGQIPPAPVLLGLVGDELWVAVSLSSGALISDPFRRSAEIARLVFERGHQLTIPEPRPVGSRRLGLRRGALPAGLNAPSAAA